MTAHAAIPAQDRWTAAGAGLRVRCYDPPAPQATAVVLHGLVAGIDPLMAARPGVDPFERLAAEGLAVAALDWPGHGRSGGRRGVLSYRAAMAAVGAAVDLAVDRWPTPVGLVGTGLGGTLALYGGIEDRRVQAVVAQGPVDLRDVVTVPTRAGLRSLPTVAARLRRRLPPGVARRTPVSARLLVGRFDLAGDPATAEALWRHPQAVRRYPLEPLASLLLEPADKPDVAAARAPTLLAAGDADPLQQPGGLQRVAARLACPKRTWVLPGAGPQLLVDHPEAAAPTFGAFLREHLTNAATG
jgi:alpha-beta hydrolase superfamily lysophospholipase